MMIMFFMSGCIQYITICLVPIYVSDLPFTDSVSVGLVMAVTSLISAVAQPLWGIVADRSKTKNRVLSVMLLVGAIVIWLLILPNHVALLSLLPCIILTFSFITVPTVLSETIIAENYPTTGMRFSAIKSFTSWGASFIAFALFIINRYFVVQTKHIFIIVSLLLMLSLIPLKFIPPTAGHGHVKATGRKVTLKDILNNKQLVLVLCFGLFHVMCTSCYSTFFTTYYTTQQGLGAGPSLFSLYYTISIMGEAVFMLFGSKLIGRFKVHSALLMGPLAGIGRCFVVYFSPNPYIMMSTVVFQALMVGPLSSKLVVHIQDIVPSEMRATGLSLWSFMSSGICAILGSSLSGVIVKTVGIHNLFLVIGAAMFLVFVVFGLLFRRHRILDDTT